MSGLGRASALIGAGTIVSRLTGFLRTIVLVSAIGSVSFAADAWQIAYSLPNAAYAIISTGLLTAVIVPQIVKAASHADGGHGYISKLFTLGAVILLVATVAAVLIAPSLVQLYSSDFSPEQRALSTAFAYWLLPQIFFFGLFALLGEILNARRVFGPYTWAPIVNNVISIAGFIGFVVIFGGPFTEVAEWTPEMIAVLAGSATAGIIAQCLVLMLFWRRAGLHLRPDFRWRGVGLRNVGRLAGWTFLMVVIGQIAGIVQANVLTGATGDGPANFSSANAWLIFMLPYSIIVLSIGTPYFTRLSEHAGAQRHLEVRGDIVRSIRTLGLFTVGASAALAVASAPAARIFTNDSSEASAVGVVLQCFLVSLVPLAVLFVVQRTFYAYDDTRTPFFFTLFQGLIVVGTALLVAATVAPPQLAAGIALGQSLATIAQVLLAAWLLHRKLGGIGTREWMRSLGRFVVAAVPAALVGWGVFLLCGGSSGWTTSNVVLGALGATLIGTVTLAVYLGALALFRAPELDPAIEIARRFLPRR